MTTQPSGRWPTIYDSVGLERGIGELARSLMPQNNNAESQYSFYELGPDNLTRCQGDIIKLESDIPLIAEDGQPAIDVNLTGLWLVIGNSCDFDRDIGKVPWSQIVPLSFADSSETALRDFRSYKFARRFYVPPWSSNESHYVADFIVPVTIHKTALKTIATLQARLTMRAWTLLHSCIVRFLARDDGRND